ncbi:glycosyltransferase [Bradyrhizobium sp. USDA 4502]
MVKVPSVCSALDPYANVIDDEKNGFLASSTQDWIRHLSALVQSKTLRNEIGEHASRSAHERFHPDRLADLQVKPLLQALPPSSAGRLRIMIVNDLLPNAVGHAAAQFASQLMESKDYEVVFLHGFQSPELPLHALHVNRVNNLTLVGLTHNILPTNQYWNDDVARKFKEVLDIWQPDLVCIFDVREMSFSVLPACTSNQTPYLVSLHNDWWLCESNHRQAKDPCLPFANDLRHRAAEADNPLLTYHRYFELRESLLNASLLLALNENLRQLYLSHGLSESHIVLAATNDRPDEHTNLFSLDTIIRRAARANAAGNHFITR